MRPILPFLFKRAKPSEPAPVSRTLPPAVAAMIDTVSLVSRPADENGPRVVCQFDGRPGFIFDDQTAAKALNGIFHDLNDPQRSQAVQRIRARVKAHLRGLDYHDPQKSKAWKDRF